MGWGPLLSCERSLYFGIVVRLQFVALTRIVNP